MEKHILTQEDLDNYPELVEQVYEVGQEIDWPIEGEELPGESSTQDDGGEEKEGTPGDPIGTDPTKKG